MHVRLDREGPGPPVCGVEAVGLGAPSGFGAFEAFLILLMAVAWCRRRVAGSAAVQVLAFIARCFH